MGKNRLNKLLTLIWQYWEVDESDLDKGNPWRYVEGVETDFNIWRMEKITAGWLLAADEGMSFYLGAVGDPTIQVDPYKSNPKLLPKICHVPRKPKPLGKEIKMVADAQCGVHLRIEFQRGKEEHAQQKWFAEYGHTIAQSMRLTEPWHGSKRAYAADSWFGSVTAKETLQEFGEHMGHLYIAYTYIHTYIHTCIHTCVTYLHLYPLSTGIHSTFDVKTNSARYPIKYIMENCGQESGAWIVLKSTDVNGEPMFALGHRRGGVVHYFISSHGQTLRGKDQAHKEDLETVEGIMAPRPCPKILNDVTLAQPKIDSNNRYRQ